MFGANVLHLVYIGIMLFDVLTEVVSSIEQVGLCRKTVNPPALFGLVGYVLGGMFIIPVRKTFINRRQALYEQTSLF